ncbi:hypothetical protein BH09SUM1_BH09SUM1_28830 [soil metagenome]
MKTFAFLFLALLTTACGGGAKKSAAVKKGAPLVAPQSPAPVQQPIVVWIDRATTLAGFTNAVNARDFVRSAKAAGVTHLAVEEPVWNATASPSQTQGAEWLQKGMQAEGIRQASVVPLFSTADVQDTSTLSHHAAWNGKKYIVAPQTPERFSPADRPTQLRELDRLKKIASDPTVDVIVLAGLGFEDTNADVGPVARAAFESAVNSRVRRWPSDVLGGGTTAPAAFGPDGRGPVWNAWMQWRADVLRRFLLQCGSAIASARSGEPAEMIVLVDAPYPAHQRQGLNWSAPLNMTCMTDNAWLPPEYANTASGHLPDAVALGFWRPDLLRQRDAELAGVGWWGSVEGASVAGRRYLDTKTKLWGAVPVAADNGWAAAARADVKFNDGLLLISGREFVASPKNWELLRAALSEK